MTIGTKSLLFGAHCFFIHPIFVALAWFKLYWFPLDPRLWIAFIIHDWGYWGCPEIDGERGEQHPCWAALFAYRWFPGVPPGGVPYGGSAKYAWYCFMAYHSRFLAKQCGTQPSMLCYADKLAFMIEPWWLYLPRTWATGELPYYMADAVPRYGMNDKLTARAWHRAAATKLARVAFEGAARYWREQDEKLSPADRRAV